MEKASIADSLNFSNDKDILKYIKSEIIYFSSIIIKVNRFSMSQERNIVITNQAIYNFKKKSLKRRIELTIIYGITISKSSDEFIIHGIEREYDYLYVSDNRKEIIGILSKLYYDIKGRNILFSQINESSLKNYVTLKKEKQNNPSFSRMSQENVISIEEYLGKQIGSNSKQNNGKEKKELPMDNENSDCFDNVDISNGKSAQLEDFKKISVIGRGAFGKVMLVEHINEKKCYAMKALRLDLLLEHQQLENTLLEQEILMKINHPFLCNLLYTFRTEDRIYFIMPFLSGGELFHHLQKAKQFDEERVRFYGAQISLALGYLHSKAIIYRDLKPENILIDKSGYLCLADFGMAKKLKPGTKAMTICGTQEYISPESLANQGYNTSADWWSFGILLYEMLCGHPPWMNDNIEKLYELIQRGPLKFPKQYSFSADAQDIIEKLLEKDPNNRLGSKGGIKEIIAHPFFSTLDFDMILHKKLPAPFIPTITNQSDIQHFDDDFTLEDPENSYIPQKNIELINNNKDKFNIFN